MQITIGELPKTVAQACGLGENERSEHALAGVGVEPHAPEDLKRPTTRLGVAWWSLKWNPAVRWTCPDSSKGTSSGISTANGCARSRTSSGSSIN